MKKSHLQHAIIAVGVCSFGFLFWYLFLPPSGDQPLTVDQLRELLVSGETPQQRALGAAGLGERGDKASMSLLLSAMEDESPLVRARAGVSVRKILGTDFFFNPEAPPQQRAEVVAKYHALWEAWKEKTGYNPE